MKDKIELTRAAFERWLGNAPNGVIETRWKELCAEAEKREPVVAFGLLSDNGNVISVHPNAEYLARHYPNSTIIKLVEEVSK